MNAFVTIAVGNRKYFELAINSVLSVKANEEIPYILIHDDKAVKGMEDYLELFDYKIQPLSTSKFPQVKSMIAKMLALDYIEMEENEIPKDLTKFILLDADVLILPDKKPSELFNQQGSFVPYIHTVYNYETQETRENANFWCDPLKAKSYFKLRNDLPQINASFIYFTREAKPVFDLALEIWNDDKFPHVKFRGSKTEEMCFNIAMSKLGIAPRQNPYRPIFFQCYAENHEESYIQHNYTAMGLAGEIKHNPAVIALYNRHADYYRNFHGIKKMYQFVPVEKKKSKVKHIDIPCVRRTLFRAGELPKSDGGIFNPDGIIHQGKLIEIYRKEANYDLYKARYSHTTAYPHVSYEGNDLELKIVGWENVRLEDFRLFNNDTYLYCNHTVAHYGKGKEKLQGQQYDKIGVGISIITNGSLRKAGEPDIPKQNLEKNWVMWIDGKKQYLLYSINPFVLYEFDNQKEGYNKVEVKQPKFKWFHDKFICASTNPIEVDGYLLAFFHTKEHGIYYHGALLMNKKTKVIEHQMKRPIKIEGRNDGMQKGLHYLSGAVLIGDKVRAYIGENDSHSYYLSWSKKDLLKAIKK